MALFAGKDKGLLGLDIGAASIKLAELASSGGGHRLQAAAIEPLPPGAIVENSIKDAQLVAQAIRRAIDKAGTTTRRVAVGVAGNAVIVKTITLPEMSELDLEGQIAYEADQYVPYDMDELNLDFHVLGPAEHDPGQMDVLLAVCKKSLIEEVQQLLALADLELVCVDCAVLAIQNMAEVLGAIPTGDDAPQAVALVDIGGALLHVNILLHGRTTFVRDHFIGGNDLTRAIQKETGLSFQQAEQRKIEGLDAIPDAIVDHYLGQLAAEVMRALDFYAANHAHQPVGRILLSGGGAMMPGLDEALGLRLGIEVGCLQPFPTIALPNDKGFDPAVIRRHGPQMIEALGLALRGVDAA